MNEFVLHSTWLFLQRIGHGIRWRSCYFTMDKKRRVLEDIVARQKCREYIKTHSNISHRRTHTGASDDRLWSEFRNRSYLPSFYLTPTETNITLVKFKLFSLADSEVLTLWPASGFCADAASYFRYSCPFSVQSAYRLGCNVIWKAQRIKRMKG